jgi:uncharacterized protein (DUF952 family)
MVLFHITSEAAWKGALQTGEYTADSLTTEGFIHCSETHQVAWVANQRFRGRQDLVLLRIEPARLHARVVHENLEGGEQLFPHVYGTIPVGAVVEVIPLRPGPTGEFDLQASTKASKG